MNDAHAGRAQGMAQRDGAAVDIDKIAVEAQLFLAGEILRREGFIDFNAFDVGKRASGDFQDAAYGRHRADAHDRGVNTGITPGHDAAEILPARLVRNNERGAAIDNAGGVAGGDGAILAEGRPQFSQSFHRGVSAAVIVRGENLNALASGDFHWHDFILEITGRNRRRRRLLRAQREGVLLGAGNIELIREILRGLRHVKAALRVHQVFQQRINELRVAQPQSLAGAAHQEGGLRHRFHAARQHMTRLAEIDPLRRVDHGLQAGAAQPVDRQRRTILRNAGLEHHMARAIN